MTGSRTTIETRPIEDNATLGGCLVIAVIVIALLASANDKKSAETQAAPLVETPK